MRSGPAVSGDYVKEWPNHWLLRHETNASVFVGHNSHEGKLFVNPDIKTNADFNSYVSNKVLGFLSDGQINHVLNVLYPAEYNGSQPYATVQGRLAKVVEEAFINCNAHILAKDARTPAYGYIFDVPPGLHGQDIAYSFYTPGLPAPYVKDEALASEMQSYLTRFAKTGDPNGGSGVTIPKYQSASIVMDIEPGGFGLIKDDAANARCTWWAENI